MSWHPLWLRLVTLSASDYSCETAKACFLFDSMALASFSPSRHTSTEVPDWKHFCTSLHTAARVSRERIAALGFLQPLMVTVAAN